MIFYLLGKCWAKKKWGLCIILMAKFNTIFSWSVCWRVFHFSDHSQNLSKFVSQNWTNPLMVNGILFSYEMEVLSPLLVNTWTSIHCHNQDCSGVVLNSCGMKYPMLPLTIMAWQLQWQYYHKSVWSFFKNIKKQWHPNNTLFRWDVLSDCCLPHW